MNIDGPHITDVWESREAFEKFTEEKTAPSTQRGGRTRADQNRRLRGPQLPDGQRSQAMGMSLVSAVSQIMTLHIATPGEKNSVTDLQDAGGVTDESFHRMADDANIVPVIHYFDSVAKARTFFGGQDLLDAMKRGGVQGEPRIEFCE
jgi:hypothetical protein